MRTANQATGHCRVLCSEKCRLLSVFACPKLPSTSHLLPAFPLAYTHTFRNIERWSKAQLWTSWQQTQTLLSEMTRCKAWQRRVVYAAQIRCSSTETCRRRRWWPNSVPMELVPNLPAPSATRCTRKRWGRHCSRRSSSCVILKTRFATLVLSLFLWLSGCVTCRCRRLVTRDSAPPIGWILQHFEFSLTFWSNSSILSELNVKQRMQGQAFLNRSRGSISISIVRDLERMDGISLYWEPSQ